MRDRQYVDVFNSENMRNVHEDRKMTKFFRWAIPILILEILVVIAIAVYFFILPKNYCSASVNMKEAVLYINNRKGNKIRLDNPNKPLKYYYYAIDLCIELPDDYKYLVSFEVKCDKYDVFATTSVPKQDNQYHLTMNGGEKIQLISGITIVSDELIKNFDVDIEIIVKKAIM